MSKRRQWILALGLTALLVSGCASHEAPTATPTPTLTPTPTETVAPEPSVLTVSLDGLALAIDGDQLAAPFDDAAAVLALLERVAGPIPDGEPLEVIDGLDPEVTRYDWDSIIVWADNNGLGSRVRISAAVIGETTVVAAGGIPIGSTRAEALSLGAVDGADNDDDGVADSLVVDTREVTDVPSLQRPGENGREFVSLDLDGDLVSAISAPDNDFGDV